MKIIVAVAAFAFTLATTSQAEDWLQYRGNQGDGKSGESIGEINWSNGPKQLWKTPTELGFSSFSIANGHAYTLVARNDREVCLALDADTGKEIWSTPLGSNKYAGGGGSAGAPGNKGGDGPRSTPTLDGKHVYVYDAHLVLTCLDAKSGSVIWQHDIMKEHAGRNIKWSNATSPVISGDNVIVAGGGEGQTYLAFNKTTGEVAWKSGDDTITHATPTLTSLDGKTQLIFFMKSGLVSIDPANGQEIWSTVFKYATSSAASPVVDDDLIYCSAGYGVGAGLFRANGKSEPDEVWYQENKLMNHWSTPVALDGHLYGIFEFKKYGKAPLQCVEMVTGEIKWKEPGFGPGNCILVDDKLVVLSDAGEVAIVKASPDKYTELARADVLDGKCWSTPAFSDGKIYVRSTKEAACLDMN